MTQKKKKPGPSTTFTPEIGNEICSRVSIGHTLRDICRDQHMPPLSTLLGWLSREDPDEQMRAFQSRYTRARRAQAETYLAELRELERTTTPENAKAHQVRSNILQWMASKLNPALYSDHARVEHLGTVKHEHSVDLVPDWLKERLEGPGKEALARIQPVIDVEPIQERDADA